MNRRMNQHQGKLTCEVKPDYVVKSVPTDGVNLRSDFDPRPQVKVAAMQQVLRPPGDLLMPIWRYLLSIVPSKLRLGWISTNLKAEA